MNTQYVYDPVLVNHYEQKRWWLGMTISDVLDKNADLYPDKEALVGQGQRFTYAGLRDAADRMAYGLIKQGLIRGDRVMLQLPNWPEFILAHYALQKAGLVMVLLTVNHTAREISHLAELTEPRGWILPRAYRDTDYQPLIQAVTEKVRTLDKVITIGGAAPPGCIHFSNLSAGDIDTQKVRDALAQARSPEMSAIVLPTGATTNLPKCAVRTHNDYLCNVEYKSRAWDINTTDTCLVATTVGHNLALLVTISGPIFHGAKIVLLDSTQPEDFFQAVAEEKVTCTGLVPTLISRFVAYEEMSKFDLSSLTRVYVGAANSPPELVNRVETRLGCRYVTAFGMVEGPCSQTRPPILWTYGRKPSVSRSALMMISARCLKMVLKPPSGWKENWPPGAPVSSPVTTAIRRPISSRLHRMAISAPVTWPLSMLRDASVLPEESRMSSTGAARKYRHATWKTSSPRIPWWNMSPQSECPMRTWVKKSARLSNPSAEPASPMRISCCK